MTDSLPTPRKTLIAVAEEGKNDIKAGFPTDGVEGRNNFDVFGRATNFTGDQLAASTLYGKDPLGREGGFPEKISQGALFQKLNYTPGDQRGNRSLAESFVI